MDRVILEQSAKPGPFSLEVPPLEGYLDSDHAIAVGFAFSNELAVFTAQAGKFVGE